MSSSEIDAAAASSPFFGSFAPPLYGSEPVGVPLFALPPGLPTVPPTRDSLAAFDTQASPLEENPFARPKVGRYVWAATLLALGLVIGSAFGPRVSPSKKELERHAGSPTTTSIAAVSNLVVTPTVERPTATEPFGATPLTSARVSVALAPKLGTTERKGTGLATKVPVPPSSTGGKAQPAREPLADVESAAAAQVLAASKAETASSL